MSTHPRDLVSLFFGLVFVIAGGAFLNESEGWYAVDSASLLALGLIGLGVVGVALVLAGARRGGSVDPDADLDAVTDDAGAEPTDHAGPT